MRKFNEILLLSGESRLVSDLIVQHRQHRLPSAAAAHVVQQRVAYRLAHHPDAATTGDGNAVMIDVMQLQQQQQHHQQQCIVQLAAVNEQFSPTSADFTCSEETRSDINGDLVPKCLTLSDGNVFD